MRQWHLATIGLNNAWLYVGSSLKKQCEHDDLAGQVNLRVGTRNINVFGGYSIALKRNHGHASASSAVAMLAGDAINGAFSDHSGGICTRYEERACRCQRLASVEDYAAFDELHADAAVPPPLVDDPRGPSGSTEIVCLEGDATKQEWEL